MAKLQSFYFSDGPYLQIMQGLHSALSMHEALIKLIGGPQTGKSLLCQKFTQFLKRKDYRVVYFNAAIESPEILRGMLGREFDLPPSSNFPRLLEDALQLEGEKPVVLIFDDAHLLTDVTLLEIYRLAEVQADTKRMLNIVLCGEPSLESRLLSNQEFRALLQSISHRFVLEPMDQDTLGQFFYRYMDKAGLSGLQLETAAMSAFFKASKGYPGPALSICKLIVAARAANEDVTPISKEEFQQLIKAAASDQVLPSTGYRESYRELSRFGPVVPLAAVLIIASVGFLYQQIGDDSSQSIGPASVDVVATEVAPIDSPFTAEVAAEQTEQAVMPVEERAVPATEDSVPLGEPEQEVAAVEIPEPVSDSSLALVTAQERGVATDAISMPEFESLDEAEEEVTESAVAIEINSEEVSASEIAESPQEEELLETGSTALATASADTEPADDALVVTAVATPANEEVPETSASERDSVTEIPTAEQEDLVAADTTVPPDQNQVETSNAVAADAAILPADSDSESSSDIEVDLLALQTAVTTWVDAWQAQSLEDYFASYHTDFQPRYHDSQSQWRSNRQRVIGGADWIRLEMTDYAFVGEEAGMQEVRFWLRYESPSYSDTTQKKLLLQLDQGEWKIMEEINLQVRS